MSKNCNDYPVVLAAVLTLAASANATIPYTPSSGPSGVGFGAVPHAPHQVFGKEYSHDLDQTTSGGGGSPDPQQLVAWDGLGGTADGIDFSGSRPGWSQDQQIDAIAHSNDLFFPDLLEDRTHLLFSHDDRVNLINSGGGLAPFSLPASGLVPLSNGTTIGGAGEVSIERAAGFSPAETQGIWAAQGLVNGMPLPADLDGLEIWGPEPPAASDTDKYSLERDHASGVSVWNGSGSGYLNHFDIIVAVENLLGPIPGTALLTSLDLQGRDAINVDALMVYDVQGDQDSFDPDPAGGLAGDSLLFSISQIYDATDPTGYYATGSELFLLDATTGVSFLHHGGHAWDKSYALASLAIAGPSSFGTIDINALETINGLPPVPDSNLPEPTCVALLGSGLLASVARSGRRRRQSA